MSVNDRYRKYQRIKVDMDIEELDIPEISLIDNQWLKKNTYNGKLDSIVKSRINKTGIHNTDDTIKYNLMNDDNYNKMLDIYGEYKKEYIIFFSWDNMMKVTLICFFLPLIPMVVFQGTETGKILLSISLFSFFLLLLGLSMYFPLKLFIRKRITNKLIKKFNDEKNKKEVKVEDSLEKFIRDNSKKG